MKKEKDILIRISPELKEKVKNKATSMGISVSAYVRMLILKEILYGYNTSSRIL